MAKIFAFQPVLHGCPKHIEGVLCLLSATPKDVHANSLFSILVDFLL